MIVSSHPPSVPLFHSLGNGTVEHVLSQWNTCSVSGTPNGTVLEHFL